MRTLYPLLAGVLFGCCMLLGGCALFERLENVEQAHVQADQDFAATLGVVRFDELVRDHPTLLAAEKDAVLLNYDTWLDHVDEAAVNAGMEPR